MYQSHFHLSTMWVLLAICCSAILMASPVMADRLLTYSLDLPASAKLSLGYHPDTVLDFKEITEKHGYSTGDHFVTTEDGYILRLFHMVNPNCATYKKTPVLLMHESMLTSDSFIDMGPKGGLAYHLADACFDLWLGNFRGNYYSRNHTTLNPDVDAAYWHHSVDEYGSHDMPALIDYVLKQTAADTLNLVGHSQGASSFLNLAAEKTEYNKKVKVVIGLNLLTRLLNTRAFLFRLLMTTVNTFESLFRMIGIQEWMFKGSVVQAAMEYLCQTDDTSSFGYKICSNFIFSLDSYRIDSITPETYKLLFSHYPAGITTRSMARCGQSLYSEKYEKYDFGSEALNLEHYGTITPYEYNLTRVTTPVVILYGKQDFVTDPDDVMWAAAQLPNLVELSAVSDPRWNHFDMVYNLNAKTLVYPRVVDYLNQYD